MADRQAKTASAVGARHAFVSAGASHPVLRLTSIDTKRASVDASRSCGGASMGTDGEHLQRTIPVPAYGQAGCTLSSGCLWLSRSPTSTTQSHRRTACGGMRRSRSSSDAHSNETGRIGEFQDTRLSSGTVWSEDTIYRGASVNARHLNILSIRFSAEGLEESRVPRNLRMSSICSLPASTMSSTSLRYGASGGVVDEFGFKL